MLKSVGLEKKNFYYFDKLNMEEIKKQSLFFPKTFFVSNLKELKEMKKRIRCIKKDFNIFSNIYTGRPIEHSLLLENEKKLSILSKLKGKKLQNNLNISFRRKTIPEPKINYKKGKKKHINSADINKGNKNMTPSPNKKIKYIKLNSYKKDIFAQTSRVIFRNSFFKKEFINEAKNNLKPIFDNKLLKIKLLNKDKIRNLLKRNKSQINNNSTKYTLKKLFIDKNKKLIEKIDSFEKNFEEEEEKILNEKIKSDKIIKRLIIKSKLNKDFEKQFKKDANSYKKEIGLFYRTKNTGLYTSHFCIILRKDNIFSNDIIHKMPQYYHFVN